MNEIVKKIEELGRQISYIEFQDHLSFEDEETISRLKNEIKELQQQLKGTKGIAVYVTYKDTAHFGNNGWYLSDDPMLCCSNEPVLFDSKEEAQDYLDKAKLDPEMYNIEFKEITL